MTTAVVTETSVMAEAYGEQRAFQREHAAGAYSVLAYHLQWVIRLNAQAVWKGLLFGAVVYWWPEQVNDSAEAFFYFLAQARPRAADHTCMCMRRCKCMHSVMRAYSPRVSSPPPFYSTPPFRWPSSRPSAPPLPS